MTHAASTFHAFAAKFALVACAIAMASIATVANSAGYAADETRPAVTVEWVKNVPVLGMELSFN